MLIPQFPLGSYHQYNVSSFTPSWQYPAASYNVVLMRYSVLLALYVMLYIFIIEA